MSLERLLGKIEDLAESRATFLSSQDDLFEEAFTEALNDFEDLPEDRYRVWLKRVIMENVSGGKEKVIAAPYDRRLLDEGLLEEINVEIEERGGKGSLSLARESAEFSRGVILKSRNFVNNLSLETLMREVRDRHEEDVLKMLFGEVDVRGASR
jgi:V/A-type H+-transporting ATPase subunit E